MVLYQEKQDPVKLLDELIKNTPFLHIPPEFLSDKNDDSAWKRIQDEASEMKKTKVKMINSSPQIEEKAKMITPISFAPPAPEEKVTLNAVNVIETEDEDFTTPLNSFNTIAQKLKIPETDKNISEVDKGLENIREKRKVKPSESLKSPYFQRVVVMKQKLHENEKKVADTIFAARGDLE